MKRRKQPDQRRPDESAKEQSQSTFDGPGALPFKPFFSAKELALLTGTSSQFWWDQARAGLRHKRLGASYDPEYWTRDRRQPGKIVFAREDVQRFLDDAPEYGEAPGGDAGAPRRRR